MELFKRVFASLGLVALLAVSGTALADDEVTDSPTDLAPNGAPYCPTLRSAESFDITATSVDSGAKTFEFSSGIIDADVIDENLLADFSARGSISYEEFADFLKLFGDSSIDLSTIQGTQDVVIFMSKGGTCTGNEWHGSAALSAGRYAFKIAEGDEDVQKCEESYSSEETILELSIDGENPFTYTRDSSAVDPDRKYSSLETDEIDKHIAMLKKFEIEGVTYIDQNKDDDEIGFEDFLKEFGKDFDLSGIHGERTVTLVHDHGDVSFGEEDGKCVGVGGGASVPYTFTVYFPTTPVVPAAFLMPMFFDGKELAGSSVPLRYGADPNFDRLQALNGKEMSVGEFLTVMGEMGALTEDFPKVGEAYGKHTVKFDDYVEIWSVVTVVYPDKPDTGGGSGDGNGQATPTPPAPVPPRQSNPPATNSQNGGSQAGNSGDAPVVRASDMSYRQFRGNDATLTPIVPAPSQATPVTSGPTANSNVDDKQKSSVPKLPVTSNDKSGAALVTDDSSTASQSALLALAACVGFGVVAAVSVISVRRYLKSDS